jgi:hypothetical protein
VVKQVRNERIDPAWPDLDGAPPVSELASSLQGALSPYGDDVMFPLPAEALPYEHPVTKINKS